MTEVPPFCIFCGRYSEDCRDVSEAARCLNPDDEQRRVIEGQLVVEGWERKASPIMIGAQQGTMTTWSHPDGRLRWYARTNS